MGDDLSAPVIHRKLKFAPKIPTKKASKAVPAVKKEAPEESSNMVLDNELLRRVKQAELAPGRKSFKDEKKGAPIQVTFGHQSAGTYARSFGIPKPPQRHEDDIDAPGRPLEKEYVEPWDYYSDYPVTLPLRRPYSGNPEILDEEEFGEASEVSTREEAPGNAAAEIGLMAPITVAIIDTLSFPITDDHYLVTVTVDSPIQDDGGTPKMIFFQLPSSLPLAEKCGGIESLPAGFMGKLVVYKSGIMKMKLGSTSFDVRPGSKCSFAQDVMGINTSEKQCSLLGELSSRAIVTPDVTALLETLGQL